MRSLISNPRIRMASLLSALVVGMFGFGFALAPLYQLICGALGINSLGNASNQVSEETITRGGVDSSHRVTMEFDATVNAGAPFELRPLTRKLQLFPGQVMEMEYLVTNLSDQHAITQSVPSVTPWQAGEYLKKVECFCFAQQPLDAGESKRMRLRFSIDRNIPQEYKVITLSYTLMDTDRTQLKQASALEPRAEGS
ncbi:cytochrome c oxidase assembly protein [Aestuariirhabdus litorea]|uniref:Cytochrome c oxidase assembly protein CtaG n=1 Tax=Aestuariirhabdus litorea TaxID=2528527 RepID=A0A3P3VL15_9GAMM|nr:cytochrome c oxidase assembly protein [Aestuariirhabdus litorea]RRJ82568.1 cytochrome c oxidase assembly protein [Aestuariirhabdus litorea]RWW92727.1 cytochrome c oxidase assembly protein [Endozoicomonadaceae bacterium GTF-13]